MSSSPLSLFQDHQFKKIKINNLAIDRYLRGRGDLQKKLLSLGSTETPQENPQYKVGEIPIPGTLVPAGRSRSAER